MTETDATRRPLSMPAKFLPKLEKQRVYLMIKDMVRDVIVHLPKDHIRQMRDFAARHLHSVEAMRLMLLVDPETELDKLALAKQLKKDFGSFVITRRCVMDRYEKHDDYVPGNVDLALMAEVTKCFTIQEPVPQFGWIMFDHPCTFREARHLQQIAVLPSVTLVLRKPPPVAPKTVSNLTAPRTFYQQDFEGLKYAYQATLKEVYVNPDDNIEGLALKCFNAVLAFNAGHQGPKQGFNAVGAPSVYRVLLIGPRGSGCSSQGAAIAKHFGLVFVHFDRIFSEAANKKDELGEKIRKYGTSIALRGEVVKNRLQKKDCIDHGWVMVGYPKTEYDYELLDAMDTPPNRFLKGYLNFTRAGVGRDHISSNEALHIIVIELHRFLKGYLNFTRAGVGRDHISSNEALHIIVIELHSVIFMLMDLETCRKRSVAVGFDYCTGENVPMGSGPRVVRHPDHNEQRREYEWDVYFTEQLAELQACAGLTAVEIDANQPFDKVHMKIQAAVMAAPHLDMQSYFELCNNDRAE